MSSFESEIAFVVNLIINSGTSEQAIELMTALRKQAQILDSALADPRKKWKTE